MSLYGRRARAKTSAAPAWLVALVTAGRPPEPGNDGHEAWCDGHFFGDVPRPAELLEAHEAELLAALRRTFPRASVKALEHRLRVIGGDPLHFADELRAMGGAR